MIKTRRIDFTLANDMQRYLDMLDAYARDPMGDAQPLASGVAERLATDLPTHPCALGLLAENDGTAVGFATCFVGYSTFRARPLINVHDIAVLPAWRGQGVADALISAIEKEARRIGCCRLTLEVRTDNLRARRVYERHGFVPGDCNLFMQKSV